MTLVDFNTQSELTNWYVVDDGVMGGLSAGSFTLNSQGHAVFKGTVSLANNGGFSSVRHVFSSTEVSDYQFIKLLVKGDGKRYQFRLKSSPQQRYSYIQYFETNGEWQTIRLKLADFFPYFRGYKLNLPNFDQKELREIAFLIGNKKEESFALQIDKIELE